MSGIKTSSHTALFVRHDLVLEPAGHGVYLHHVSLWTPGEAILRVPFPKEYIELDIHWPLEFVLAYQECGNRREYSSLWETLLELRNPERIDASLAEPQVGHPGQAKMLEAEIRFHCEIIVGE